MPLSIRMLRTGKPPSYRAATKIQALARRRKARKALPKKAKTEVKSIVKSEIGRQAESYMNFGRYLYQASKTAQNTFEGAQYFLINLGGSIQVNAETSVPMKTINAQAIQQNAATGTTYNQSYKGTSIYGKYMRTKVNLVMPSIKTIGVGGADWQQMPQNYEYRFIIFKTKPQPANNYSNTTDPGAFAPFSINGFKNEVGTTFGIRSDDTTALPDPTGAPMNYINEDLMRAPVNKTNFTVLYEKRGRISPGTAMNATDNNASVTNGGKQYSNEANFTYTHKINKKLNLQLTDETPQSSTAPPSPVDLARVTNYDTSIMMYLVLSPVGEGDPSSLSSAANWNSRIKPYIHVHNSFTFTDM